MSKWSNWKNRRRNRNKPKHDDASPNHLQNPTNDENGSGASLDTGDSQQKTEGEEHYAAERRFWERQIRVAIWLNAITAGAAVVGLIGLIFVYISIVHADESTIDANRAWIAPRTQALSKNPTVGQPFQVNVEYDNIGHSPATDVRISIINDEIDAPSDRDMTSLPRDTENICEKYPPNIDLGTLYQTASAVSGGNTSFGFLQTNSTVGYGNIVANADNTSGRKFYRLRACISYITYKKTHTTRFCALFIPHVNVGISCNGGTGAD